MGPWGQRDFQNKTVCVVSLACAVWQPQGLHQKESASSNPSPLLLLPSSHGIHLGSIWGWHGEWPSPSCLLMLVGGQEMLSKDHLLPWVKLCCSSSSQVPDQFPDFLPTIRNLLQWPLVISSTKSGHRQIYAILSCSEIQVLFYSFIMSLGRFLMRAVVEESGKLCSRQKKMEVEPSFFGSCGKLSKCSGRIAHPSLSNYTFCFIQF